MPGDDAVLKAAQAFRAGDAEQLAAAAPGARGHVLESYVDYWQLQLRLQTATPDAVHAFLRRYPDTVVAQQLKADWIRELGRREQWEALLAEHPAVKADDSEGVCLVARARLNTGDKTGGLAGRGVWDQARPLPDACLPLMEKLVASGEIKAADIWLRGRTLLQSNDIEGARQAYGYLPAREQPSLHALSQASATPQHYLSDRKLALGTRADRETAIFAVDRLAREDPAEAGALFDSRMQGAFSAGDRAYVFGRIALRAARWHRPEALAWFALAAPASFTDEELAWRARAALREQRWSELQNAIQEMPARMRRQESWVYWHARAAEAQGQLDVSRQGFASIAGGMTYYGRLAAEELGQPLEIPPRVYSPSPEDVEEVSREPSLQRAIALLRLDLRPEGLREWSWSTRNYDDRHLLAAGELARRSEIWDRAINAADRTQEIHDFGLRYMAPYFETFIQQAHRLGLEDSWVLGVARQESRFVANIRSSAGAIGVMQLMPSTAKQVAKRLGLKGFKPGDVIDVETNVMLGSNYLREMLDLLDGHLLLASAAYNAGPIRADEWRGERPLEGAIYAETIPFNETRDYVQKVLFNAACYAAVLGRDPMHLKTLLGVVPPHAATLADNRR